MDSSGPTWCSSPGNPSKDDRKKERFAALGENIKSVYSGTNKSGTSFATPVAAGTAALILEFAKQPPLSLESGVLGLLKRQDGMLVVFRNILCREKEGALHINIADNFSQMYEPEKAELKEKWFDHRSNRYKAAGEILRVLKKSGSVIGSRIEDECHKRSVSGAE